MTFGWALEDKWMLGNVTWAVLDKEKQDWQGLALQKRYRTKENGQIYTTCNVTAENYEHFLLQ